MIPKNKPWRSNAYLIYIRQQPCIICQHSETDAHHVRIQSNAGTGTKPSDFYAVPLCRLHHLESHHYGRNTFLSGMVLIYLRNCLKGLQDI